MSIYHYFFENHRHVFSSWCAGTAAGASSLCRFKVATGKEIIESSELLCPSINLPDSQIDFDHWHDGICEKFITKANEIPVVGFSYGVAAKLLNCYLKAFYISSEKDFALLHPPIDRILLTALGQSEDPTFANQKKRWREFASKGGYSTWKETKNIELYADLGLEDDGNYVSFPTLYAGEYQGDPESGNWETNS